ncbi:hypothetical protein HBH56_123360 [Parastagonospora nodorum]|uniref:SWR1-complex protein 3 domain-containing protein n=1 Tax=Phaeosphaeria nodorum (strain SN15 / ATCC MYA-4574 / FGSC 10173) TaxID=321614 RepID=A0A7U2ESC4_PHANO|nr:hypothetical protein HBH56_123360 [Parastagonospora nodorum]QRC91128.1 hypothetical protein JI435_006230 [Parastagonospora nodorum SN15]KAH3934807.1 hypothetical protein HBH54_048900 [Parastagonospora nodorum]KAH4041948.1 hypothetical protein HBI09_006710 [Parastagonospora nodorum]KAH4060883.1 hypothetical protein HBH49_007870 [Parastagonospora nodorum]
MSEPRRSTRARAREEAAPAPETPKEKPAKGAKSASTLKRKRSSVVIADPTPATDSPQAPKQTLPLRITEGQPLPTLPEPQPLELPTSEWQDIQQSGVLSASMERSRAVWVSGVNFRVFHKFFNQPKKPADRTEEDKARHARQKNLLRDFPELGVIPQSKDSVNSAKEIPIQAQLVIEPHTFPIRLYAPKESMKHVPKKPSLPASYGSWPNHNQPQHSQPNQYTQYNSQGQPVYQQKPPPPRPPPPKPVQKAPPPTPGPASTPAPDPVIHMLAQRAGVDPELKSVMKIVAAGQASKEQLEFFQSHINELTAVLAKQKEEAAKAGKALPASTTPKAVAPSPAPKAVAPSPTPQPVAAPQPPPPPSRPVQPAQPTPIPQQAPKPYSPAPPQMQLQQAPPRPSHSPHPNSYNQPPQQYHQQRQMPTYNPHPQPTTYRPLVFTFEEGNKDYLHFPSYSFLEWLPNMSGAKISFLITKMKPKLEQDVSVKPPSTPAPKAMAPPTGATPSGTPNMETPNMTFAQTPNGQMTPFQPSVPPTPTPFIPQPRIEDFDEKNDIADIEFYQPVTVLLLTDNMDIKTSLARAIRPPDVVEKYMDEVFDKCKRASETYLAFRLPRDGDAEQHAEKRVRSGDGTPVVATPTMDRRFSFTASNWGSTLSGAEKKKAGRPRKSLV